MAAFKTPASFKELTDKAAPWCVRKVTDVGSEGLSGDLEDAVSNLDDDAQALVSHDVFDSLYSVLLRFAEAPPEIKELARQCIFIAIKGAIQLCKRSINTLGSEDELCERRSLLSMCTFLISSFIQEAEKAAKTAPTEAAVPKSRKGGRKVALTKSYDWEPHREQAAALLLEALTLDLKALWSHRTPDESFLLLFSNAAFALLEQPNIAKPGSAALRDTLWRLIALPVVQHEQTVSTVSSLVTLLVEHEHLAAPLAELMQHLLEEHDAAPAVALLMQEVAALAPSEASETGPKRKSREDDNVATFLHAFAARAPLMLLANFELMQQVLTSDAYSLRRGVVSACGQLLIQVKKLQDAGGVPPEVAQAAAALLPVLLERVQDTSPHVRCRTLQTLVLVCEGKAIAPEEFVKVAMKGLERLQDKNNNVRRGALQLYTALLQFNPFCDSLNRRQLADFEKRRDSAVEELATAKRYIEHAEAGSQGAGAALEPGTAESEAATATEAESEGEGDTGISAIDLAKKEELVTRIKELELSLKLLEPALAFESVMRDRLTVVTHMLGSQTGSDVLTAMDAVVAAHWLSIEGARPAAILPLVWSREANIKQAALQAAREVWLSPPPSNGDARHDTLDETSSVLHCLLELVHTSTLGDVTSLEEVLAEWQRQALLPNALLGALWETVQGRRREFAAPQHRRCAMELINMAAVGDEGAHLLQNRMDVIIQQLRGSAVDLEVARHACVAMQRCAVAKPLSGQEAKLLLRALEELLLNPPPRDQAGQWFALAEQAINAIFVVHEAPDEMCGRLLNELAGITLPMVEEDEEADSDTEGADKETAVAATTSVCTGALARFVFFLGHVAIKTLAHIEAVEKSLTKKQRQLTEDVSETVATPPRPSKGGRKAAKVSKPATPVTDDTLAEELGVDAAEAEANTERLLALSEQLLAPTSLLGSYAPLVVEICANGGSNFPAELRAAGMLTLCKFMCTSSRFCEAQLQLLFTVMERETCPQVRTNVAIALGDLVVRHPNMLEPWTDRIYMQLRDCDARVRKTMMMVLTHLILNDMLKVKGQLAQMSLCLLDPEPRIASLTRLFFTEFAKKTTAPVYNLLPDILSSLSINIESHMREQVERLDAALVEAGEKDAPAVEKQLDAARAKAVDGVAFREVMGFLIGFIDKEKQTEAMVDKLCARFCTSDALRHDRDVAFCISALSHSERSVRKLQEHAKTYATKLADNEARRHTELRVPSALYSYPVSHLVMPTANQSSILAVQVFDSFLSVVAKTRKLQSFGRAAEVKTTLDEYEAMLHSLQVGEAPVAAAAESATATATAGETKVPPPAKAKAATKAKAKARGKKPEWEEEEEDDEDQDDDEDQAAAKSDTGADENQPPAAKVKAKSGTSKPAAKEVATKPVGRTARASRRTVTK